MNDFYYHEFVALYNSWKYYENKVPIKVYVAGPLQQDRRIEIQRHCEVIDVVKPEELLHMDFYGKQLFKYVALSNHMAENEIILDADTLFLSNLDFLFDYVEDGKIVGADEGYKLNHINYYSNQEQFETIKFELGNYLGSDVVQHYTINFQNEVFNGGLLGYNKNRHYELFQKIIKLLSCMFSDKTNPIFHNEQYMASFLVSLLNYETKTLPSAEWMNTWSHHRSPKKIIKIENGKFEVHNEGGNKLYFYHFTGDIGMPSHSDSIVRACRPGYLFQPDQFFSRIDVETLWYINKENPVLLLFEYFKNKGL